MKWNNIIDEVGSISVEDAKAYIASRDEAVVVKAAGLAKGKGVFVCDDPSDGILIAEKIKGSPVSERIQGIVVRIGLALVLVLFLYITLNDVIRSFFSCGARKLAARRRNCRRTKYGGGQESLAPHG